MNLLSFSGYTGSHTKSNSLFWTSSRAGNLQLSRDKFERHALDAPPCYDLCVAELKHFYLKSINKVQRSADIRRPVSYLSLLNKILNLPLKT